MADHFNSVRGGAEIGKCGLCHDEVQSLADFPFLRTPLRMNAFLLLTSG